MIVVNTTYLRAPWADLLYACDAPWWLEHKGAPDFAGLKVTQDAQAAKRWGLKRVPVEHADGLSLEPRRIHCGAELGNGGYQALNLAVLMGARRILLLAYDMQPGANGELHHHGDHPPGLNNPDAGMMAVWAANFETTLPDLKRAGVEVINCSRATALTCFPRMPIDEALNGQA